ncbi:MAG: peptidase domain-containing ABC transporter [Raineya sp.]|jgi:ATP-binding cassette subfamily B protein|nr:peptidase domain-containing ABC transporter [Raineya sp.]
MPKYPHYKQLDMMDCAPTCLRMIASYYGKHFTLQNLREKSFLTREGASLLGLSQASESIGFRSMGVKCTFEQLIKEAPTPFIAHWNQNHFVVVYKIKKKSKEVLLTVADPAGEIIEYSEAEFLKSWASTTNVEGDKEGIVLLLEPSSEFYKQEEDEKINRASWQFLFTYLNPYKQLVTQLFIGLLIGGLLQFIFPFLTQNIVDVGIQTKNIPFIYLILSAQLMLFLARTAVEFLRRWILLHLSTRINITLISDFLAKLMKLPIGFFDTKQTGDLIQRIADHHRIESFLSTSSLNTLFSLFSLVILGTLLAFYNLAIFVVFVIGSSLYVVWIVLFMKQRRKLDHKRFQQMSGSQSNMIQLIQGMPEIKLNNCETQKRWEWERIQAKLFKINVQNVALEQYQQAGSSMINESKNILITILSAIAVMEGQISLGTMLAISSIIGQLNAPIMDFVNFMLQMQDAKISLERLGEIYQIPNEDEGLPNMTMLPHQDHSIHLKNLSFQYESSTSNKILEDIDLVIPQGKTTAIVGTSGSGKTTLLKLLLKFYTPIHGEILVGSQSLKNINSIDWRKMCGTVMQDGFLFSDTIAKNITISSENIDYDRLLVAVKTANIQEYIESLPLGYNTKIGADGIGLSQGQRQRIQIARAVYKNPEFLFFDEATSALDANNEQKITENLKTFLKGKTAVVIAHRLSTVKNADQIIVLDKGKIIEKGTHFELVQKEGAYFELVRNQLELGA